MEPQRHRFFFARNFDTSQKDAYQTLKQENKLLISFGSIFFQIVCSKEYTLKESNSVYTYFSCRHAMSDVKQSNATLRQTGSADQNNE